MAWFGLNWRQWASAFPLVCKCITIEWLSTKLKRVYYLYFDHKLLIYRHTIICKKIGAVHSLVLLLQASKFVIHFKCYPPKAVVKTVEISQKVVEIYPPFFNCQKDQTIPPDSFWNHHRCTSRFYAVGG